MLHFKNICSGLRTHRLSAAGGLFDYSVGHGGSKFINAYFGLLLGLGWEKSVIFQVQTEFGPTVFCKCQAELDQLFYKLCCSPAVIVYTCNGLHRFLHTTARVCRAVVMHVPSSNRKSTGNVTEQDKRAGSGYSTYLSN